MTLRNPQNPETTKTYRLKNKDRIALYRQNMTEEQKAVYRKNKQIAYRRNPVDVLFATAKCRAKRNNIEFNIDKSDLIIPPICPILGITISVSDDSTRTNSPSVDRIDNSKGYTKGNVRVISYKANTMKQDNTPETLHKFIQYIEGKI